jgi:hypothetical protein
MDSNLIFWTILLLGPLVWLVRQVNMALQKLAFILTGHETLTLYLYHILLLPGTALHELSHFLAASLLGVRVHSISLRPKLQGDKLQMGAVSIDQTDFIRWLLIGMAPLLGGSIAVVLIGQHIFDVGAVVEAARASDSRGIIEAIQAAFEVNDAWIWFYLIFAISNAMLPSESDRASLGPAVAFFALIVGFIVVTGQGPELIASLAEPVETALSLLLLTFGITLFVDVIFIIVIWLLTGVVGMLTGRRVEKQA